MNKAVFTARSSRIKVVVILLLQILSVADKVVVVPLGGTIIGNATTEDVVKGKIFSSRVVGKGPIGTLEICEGSTSYTNFIGMKFSPIPIGSLVMGSPAV